MAGWREIFLVVAALWLPACTLMAGNTVPADRAENARPTPRAGVVTAGPSGAADRAALESAVQDDALRAWPGVQRAQVQVAAEAVTWADGALGCPQPGVMYTQALVPGWRIVVRASGREAVYHASQRGQWLLCVGGPVTPARPGDVTR